MHFLSVDLLGGREFSFYLFIYFFFPTFFSRATRHDGESCFWGSKRGLMGGFWAADGTGYGHGLEEKLKRNREIRKGETGRRKGVWWIFLGEPSWRGSSLGTIIMVFPVYFRSSYSLYLMLCDSYSVGWIVYFFMFIGS